MLDADAKLVKNTLTFVLPNIVYPDYLREVVEEVIERSETTQNFIENFKAKISSEADNTKKTDQRIFLSEFRRRVSIKS